MKKFITLCFLVILGAGSAAFATTTSQIWYFDTRRETYTVPDVVNNGPGINPATLYVTPGPGGDWANGAWELSGEMDIILDNDPTPRERKTIQIWLKWQQGILNSFLPDQPFVGISAAGMETMTMGVAHNPIAGTPWTLSFYDIVITPNPPEEWVAIKGNIVVDELMIETECIPEPATMGLLGLGSLALLRNRRKR